MISACADIRKLELEKIMKFTKEQIQAVTRIIKKKFPNLSVDDCLTIAFDILTELSKETEDWTKNGS